MFIVLAVSKKNLLRSALSAKKSWLLVELHLKTRHGIENVLFVQIAKPFWPDRNLRRDKTSLIVLIALVSYSPSGVQHAASLSPGLVEPGLSRSKGVIGIHNALSVQCVKSPWPAKDLSLMGKILFAQIVQKKNLWPQQQLALHHSTTFNYSFYLWVDERSAWWLIKHFQWSKTRYIQAKIS